MKNINKINNKSRKRLCFTMVFIISFIICILVTGAYIQSKIQLDYFKMEHLALTRASKVDNIISNLLYKTQALSALVIQNNGEIESFERVASTLVDTPAIRNVIVAPNGIVSHVYPLTGNEALIGFNYFDDKDGNTEARTARDTGELVLGGPFTLMQGGQALVGRLPVYLEDKQGEKQFWGLVSVTLNYPEALEDAELNQLREQGYAYEIWRINPDNEERQIIASSNYDYSKNSRYVEQPFTILNARWIFRLSPIREWYQYPDTWIYLGIGLLISILITFLFIHNSNLRQVQKELEHLSNADFLTGTVNRRGIFGILEQLIRNPENRFVLSYLDINQFKQINDTFGHNIGDKILQEFAHTLKINMDKKDLLARIGGDEFVLIFTDTDNLGEAKQFFEHMQEEFDHSSHTSYLSGASISFSVGFACFPKDGVNIDKLIEAADHGMYKNKQTISP